MKPILKEFAVLLIVSPLAVISFSSLGGAAGIAQADKLRPSDLAPEHDGQEVTLTFEVTYTQHVAGEREGEFPILLLHHVRKDQSDRAVIYVKGDLADVLHRIALVAKDSLKGRTIRASGTVAAHQVLSDDGNRLPLYELELRDWKKFQVLPRQRDGA